MLLYWSYSIGSCCINQVVHEYPRVIKSALAGRWTRQGEAVSRASGVLQYPGILKGCRMCRGHAESAMLREDDEGTDEIHFGTPELPPEELWVALRLLDVRNLTDERANDRSQHQRALCFFSYRELARQLR
jgi:hypothetical protein